MGDGEKLMKSDAERWVEIVEAAAQNRGVLGDAPGQFEERLAAIAGSTESLRFTTAAGLLALPPSGWSPQEERARSLDLLGVSPDQAGAIDRSFSAVERLNDDHDKSAAHAALRRALQDLRDAGIPRHTALLPPNAVRAETLGAEQRAKAKVPVRQPLEEISWVVHPKFWTPCIRQVESVEFLVEPVPSGDQWEAPIRETVNLTRPIDVGLARVTCELDVRLSYEPGVRAQVAYKLRPGGSDVLAVNEGRIVVEPVDQAEDTLSLVTIAKRVVVRGGQPIGTLFSRDPNGLRSMLTYWIIEAQKECPLARPLGVP